LNELRAPETASSTVNLLIYFAGGPDFEFQVPCSSNQTAPAFSPQGGSELLVSETIGGNPSSAMSTRFAESSIGESFASFKQLLNRYNQIQFTGTRPVNTGSYSVSIWPWFTASSYLPSGTAAVATPSAGGDPFCNISAMYAMYKGSARVQILPLGTAPTVISAALDITAARSGDAIKAGLNKIGFSITGPIVNNSTVLPNACGIVSSDMIGPFAASAPYYAAVKSSLLYTYCTGGFGTIPTNCVDQPVSAINFTAAQPPALEEYLMSRSFGDDFQLSYFVGCPPLFLSTT